MARLDELCTLNMGQSPDSASYNEVGDGLPFFQGNADFGVLHPKIRVWCNEPTKIAHPGDILISVRAPIGAMNVADRECCIGRGLAALTVNENLCNKGYIWYAISSKVEELNAKGTGSTFKAISKGILGETEISLPSLDKQYHIASILDKLTGLISLRKQQLAKLDELVKARFVEMFGDLTINSKGLKIVHLSEVAEYFNGLTYKPENVSDIGTIVLRSSNIQDNQLDFADTVRVNCQIKERLFVRENDILMCSRNGSARLVGKVALIRELYEPMSFGAFMMIIRSKYYPYLVTYFQDEDFRRQIKTGATTTINQITGRMLDEVVLPVPELKNMAAFESFTEKIFRQKLTIQQSLDKLEVLRKSLMQEYFG